MSTKIVSLITVYLTATTTQLFVNSSYHCFLSLQLYCSLFIPFALLLCLKGTMSFLIELCTIYLCIYLLTCIKISKDMREKGQHSKQSKSIHALLDYLQQAPSLDFSAKHAVNPSKHPLQKLIEGNRNLQHLSLLCLSTT